MRLGELGALPRKTVSPPGGSLDAPKPCIAALDPGRLRTFTVDVALDDRISPVEGSRSSRFGCHCRRGQAAGHDQEVVVAIFPEAVDDLRHQFQDATGAGSSRVMTSLRRGGRRSRGGWDSLDEPVVVTAFLGFPWKFRSGSDVGSANDRQTLNGSGVGDIGKKPSYDLELFGSDGFQSAWTRAK